jgi:hypothetical protein
MKEFALIGVNLAIDAHAGAAPCDPGWDAAGNDVGIDAHIDVSLVFTLGDAQAHLEAEARRLKELPAAPPTMSSFVVEHDRDLALGLHRLSWVRRGAKQCLDLGTDLVATKFTSDGPRFSRSGMAPASVFRPTATMVLAWRRQYTRSPTMDQWSGQNAIGQGRLRRSR